MNHGMKIRRESNTLEVTVPNGTRVDMVRVNEAGTDNGGLFYPDHQDVFGVKKFCELMDKGIKSASLNDQYSLGMRDALRWAKSMVTGEKPEYEEWKGEMI